MWAHVCTLQEIAAAGWGVWGIHARDGGQPCEQETSYVGNHSWWKGRTGLCMFLPRVCVLPNVSHLAYVNLLNAMPYFSFSCFPLHPLWLSHRDCHHLRHFLRDPHCSSHCVGQVMPVGSRLPPWPNPLLPETQTAPALWRPGPATTELPSWVSKEEATR